jgi:microsomal dipeptidase-like Zn-dependent dipeptidase
MGRLFRRHRQSQIEHHNGLTEGGKQIVLEMNRLGMLVDISHVADKTFYDAIAISKAPLIASHSSARALTNHPRNMTDDMLRAVAKNGGVVQVNFYSAFIDENYRKATEAQAKDRDPPSRPTPIKSRPPEKPSPISTPTASSASGPRKFRVRRWLRSSITSTTSPKLRASTTSAWAPILTA